MLLMLTFICVSCGSDTDPSETLNDAEKKLVGIWDEDSPVNNEQFHYLFNNDKVGAYYVTDANDEIISTMTFYWSANETNIFLKSFGADRSVPYTVSATTLILGSGDERVSYTRNLGIGQ